MKTVQIKGINLSARHGVLGHEKINPQQFIIDIAFDYDASAAIDADDIEKAVNYSQVIKLAYDICKNNTFNLIEKLSHEIAFNLAESFPAIEDVHVSVHKPQAPVQLPFEDIIVTSEIQRLKAVLSLGSSEGDKRANLEGAITALRGVRGIKVLKVSDFITTAPYGGVAKGEFLNCALVAECLLTPNQLLEVINKIEGDFHRERTERWGDRTLDIDIVFFGNKIIAQEGLIIPHYDYFNRDFVLTPIKQIAPDFVCPLLRKRVQDIRLGDKPV